MANDYQLFIGGDWVDGSGPLEVRSPFDDKLVGTVQRAEAEHIEQAICAGVAAEEPMKRLAAHERRAWSQPPWR